MRVAAGGHHVAEAHLLDVIEQAPAAVQIARPLVVGRLHYPVLLAHVVAQRHLVGDGMPARRRIGQAVEQPAFLLRPTMLRSGDSHLSRSAMFTCLLRYWRVSSRCRSISVP